LVAEGFGVSIRLAGQVVPDPISGQLTTTFAENPPLPFDDLKLDFFTGPRAPLATPDNCGSYATQGAFTPWSGTAPVATADSFDITSGCGLGFTPSFSAGSTNPVADSSNTSFTLSVRRADGQQHLKRVTTVLPPGLLAKVAGVQLCPDPQATAGTCDSSSQIGTTTASAGPGPSPFFASGKVFLTGPYNGGPYGLSIVVRAVAGPFDLGSVVVRTALMINKADGHVTAVSDDIPSILQGIPLRIRSIAVQIDRPGFILNPTNCNPMQVMADIASSEGAVAHASNRFQVGDCASLPFRPSFSASTQAHANRHGASLDVKVSQRPGEAAIHKVDTQLPLALPSRLVTLQKACAEAQFAADPAGCPSGSDVGIAKAITPILNAPLTGPTYLVSHGGAAFPDLDIVLQGDGVTIVLTGNTDIKRGITYSRFEAVPDAPISSFELYLPGGPGALLAATRDLCSPTRTITASKHVMRRVRGRLRHLTVRVRKSVRASLTMPVTLAAQNGAVVRRDTPIAVSGCRSHMPKRDARPKRPKHPARRG
jgi:hypothetical protein